MAKRYPFSKSYRLKKASDFKLTYQKGHSLTNRELALYWLPREDELQKFGISVSRKVERKANRRNRLKRLLREAYRLNRPKLRKGVYLFVIVRARAKELDFNEASYSLASLLRRAKLFCDERTDFNP